MQERHTVDADQKLANDQQHIQCRIVNFVISAFSYLFSKMSVLPALTASGFYL
jgi:hypothetical protein